MAKMNPIIPLLLAIVGIILIIGGVTHYIENYKIVERNNQVNLSTLPFGINARFYGAPGPFPDARDSIGKTDGEFLIMIYFFNISNPEEYLNGSNPIVTKVGPYAYDLVGYSFNERFFEKGNIYCSASLTKYQRFQAEFSVGPETDSINVHDYVYHTLIHQFTEMTTYAGAVADVSVQRFVDAVRTEEWLESTWPFYAYDFIDTAINLLIADQIYFNSTHNRTEEEAKAIVFNAWANDIDSTIVPDWFRISTTTPSGIPVETVAMMLDPSLDCAFNYPNNANFMFAPYMPAGWIAELLSDYSSCGFNITQAQAQLAYDWYSKNFIPNQVATEIANRFGAYAGPEYLYVNQWLTGDYLGFSMLYYNDNFGFGYTAAPELGFYIKDLLVHNASAVVPNITLFEAYYMIAKEVNAPLYGRGFARPAYQTYKNGGVLPGVFDQYGTEGTNTEAEMLEKTAFIFDKYFFDPIYGQAKLNIDPIMYAGGHDPFVAINSSARSQVRVYSEPWYLALYPNGGGGGVLGNPSIVTSISQAEQLLEPECIYTGKDDFTLYQRPVDNQLKWDGVNVYPITGYNRNYIGKQILKDGEDIEVWDDILARSYTWKHDSTKKEHGITLLKYKPDWNSESLKFPNDFFNNLGQGLYNMDPIRTDRTYMYRSQVNFVNCDPEYTTDYITGLTQSFESEDFEMFTIYEQYTGIRTAVNTPWQLNLFYSKDFYYNYDLSRKMTDFKFKPGWIFRTTYSNYNRTTGEFQESVATLYKSETFDFIKSAKQAVIVCVVFGGLCIIASVILTIFIFIKK